MGTIHGKYKHPLYSVWHKIKIRCGVIKGASPSAKRNYTKRNISVCEKWLIFQSFYDWAKDKWKPGLTIDRKDNNGNYTPENCRFVTQRINNQNTRRSKRWFISGKKYKSRKDAAMACGVDSRTISYWCNGHRVGKYHYPPKKDCHAISVY